jgi:hypothetical protein
MVKIYHYESVNGFGNLKERRLNFFSISVRFYCSNTEQQSLKVKREGECLVEQTDGKLGLSFCEQAVRAQNIVTCRVVHATKMMGSSSDDWIY